MICWIISQNKQSKEIMSKQILVIADSWAYTWDVRAPQLRQLPGYDRLLTQKGYQVKNLAKPGSSNREQYQILQTELEQESYDHVIVTQTDPMRDFIEQGKLNAEFCYDRARHYEGLGIFMLNCLRNYYVELDELAKQHEVDIMIMGGCSRVLDQQILEMDLKNLRVAIPSIPELLIDNYEDHIWYDSNQWTVGDYRKLIRRDEALRKEWFSITEMILQKRTAYKSCQRYFYPDQWHPNLTGHHRIADLIVGLI